MAKSKSKNRVVSLHFPQGGVNEKLTYQKQPPYTTPDAQNVRPDNVYDYREGGGSRPGLNVGGRSGSSDEFMFLDTVTIVTNDGRGVWADDFAGTALDRPWIASDVAGGVVILSYLAQGGSGGEIDESSGLAASRKTENLGYLWIVDDDEDTSVFAVDPTDGSDYGEWTLDTTPPKGDLNDCEDIAAYSVGGTDYLFLASIGDNGGVRSTVSVFRVVEPTMTGIDGTIDNADIEEIVLQYPAAEFAAGEGRDAETLFVESSTGDIYIVTKSGPSPRTANSELYRLAYAASYSGTQTLEYLGNIWTIFKTPDISGTPDVGAVGGCMSTDGLTVLIKNYDTVYKWTRTDTSTSVLAMLQAAPTEVASDLMGSHGGSAWQSPKGECIDFGIDQSGFYMLSEAETGVSTAANHAIHYVAGTDAGALPSVVNNQVIGPYGTDAVCMWDAYGYEAINGSEPHEVSIRIVPDGGSHRGKYLIHMLRDDATPATTSLDGLVVSLELTATGGYSGEARTYNDGVLKSVYALSSGTHSASYPGWFIVRYDSGDASVWWRDTNLLDAQDISGDFTAGPPDHEIDNANYLWGFEMVCNSSTGNCIVDRVRHEHYRYDSTEEGNQEPARTTYLVGGMDGTLYYDADGFHGSLLDSVTTRDLNQRPLETAERLQKLYIADYGNVAIAGGTGAAAAVDRLTISSPVITDYDALGIDEDTFLVEITAATGDINNGTYAITSITGTGGSAGITVTGTLAAAGLTGTCTVNIQRGPKIFDPSDGTISLWTATTGSGQMPLGCNLIASWRDRLILAKDHLWYMSRVGDPHDWNYSTEDAYQDVARAVAGSVTEAGYMGPNITAVIPHADKCVIFGARRSLWIMRGDPAEAGTIDNLSKDVGIVGPQAFCYTPEQTLVFLSDDGIYTMDGRCGSLPESFSRERLPDELLHTDWAQAVVRMEYDIEARGIHIFIRYRQLTATTHWWLDWETKSLWKVAVSQSHAPTATVVYRGNDGTSSVLIGGFDGTLRHFERDCWLDDENTSITSYVMVGPLRLGPHDYFEGILSEITGVLHGSSGDVDWSIHVGDTPQAAIEASALVSGEWTISGLNYTSNPRCSGVAAIVKLAGDENIPWALEHIDVVVRPHGKRRIG